MSCIAEPTRYALLGHIQKAAKSVGDLAEATGHSQSNVSHHLRQLRECGLVTFDRVGKENRYRLAHTSVSAVLDAIEKASNHLPNCEACA